MGNIDLPICRVQVKPANVFHDTSSYPERSLKLYWAQAGQGSCDVDRVVNFAETTRLVRCQANDEVAEVSWPKPMKMQKKCRNGRRELS